MQFIKTKTGLSIILLIGVAVFVALSSGAFGGTFLGITLKTNPDLQNGLVAHYTFDGFYDEFGSEQGKLLFSTTTGSTFGYAPHDLEEVNGSLYYLYRAISSSTIFMLNPQNADVVWATTSDSVLWDMYSSGDYLYVTGYCYDYCGYTTSNYAIFTAKLRLDTGEMLWSTTTNPSSQSDVGQSVISLNGDVYVTGNCAPLSGSQAHCIGTGDAAIYTMRINGDDGSMVWATTTDLTDADDIGRSITHDGTNIYVTGNCGQTFDTDCNTLSGSDTYTMKIDASNGDMLWGTSTILGTGNDTGENIAYDNGSLFVHAGGNDSVLLNIDPSNGNATWSTTTGTYFSNNNGRTLDIDVVNGHPVLLSGSNPLYITQISASDPDITLFSTSTLIEGGSPGEPGFVLTANEQFWYVAASRGDFNGAQMYKIDMRATSSSGLDVYGAKNTKGNIGQGVEFDGVDDYMSTSYDFDPTDEQLTFAAWVRPGDLTDNGWILGKRQVTPNDGYSLSLRGGDSGDPWQFSMYGVIAQASDASGAQENTWIHMAVTYDKQNIVFYENGVLLSSHVQTGEIDSTSGMNLYIGAKNEGGDTSGTNFNGELDDVRIYDRALSATEISRLYDLGATTKVGKTLDSNPELKVGLVAHWTFDGGDMDTASNTAEVLDVSGNGVTGDWLKHATTTEPGVLGQAISLDGVNDYVYFGDRPDLDLDTAHSISAWFYLKSNPTTEFPIYVHGRAGGSDVRLDVDNTGYIHVQLIHGGGGGVGGGSNETIDLNKWYHVVAAWDGATRSLYQNGVLIDQDLYAGTPSEYNNLTHIGVEDYADTDTLFDGMIDDVRVYNYGISTSTVQRLYQLGATTKVAKTIDTNPDLESGLVGHWTFDGKDMDTTSDTGEVLDRGTGGNDGDWLDHATTTTFGVMGQAIEFDGTNDRVNIGSPASLDNISLLSLAAWVYVDDSSADRVIDKQDGSSVGWRIRYEASENEFRFTRGYSGPTGNWATPNNSVRYGEWVHIAVTHDSTGLNDPIMYVNGEAVSTTEIATPSGTVDLDAAEQVVIGGRPTAGANPWDGKIDDVRIYDRILSDAEILRLYQLGQ